MKRLLILLLLVISGVSAKCQISIGGGVNFASEGLGSGLYITGSYLITDRIEAAPSLNFLFGDSDRSTTVFDIEGRYFFWEPNFGSIYGVSGVNLNFYTYDLNQYGVEDQELKDTDPGLNLGLGAKVPFGRNWNFIPEVKFTVTGESYMRFSLGVDYQI